MYRVAVTVALILMAFILLVSEYVSEYVLPKDVLARQALRSLQQVMLLPIFLLSRKCCEDIPAFQMHRLDHQHIHINFPFAFANSFFVKHVDCMCIFICVLSAEIAYDLKNASTFTRQVLKGRIKSLFP